MTIVERKIRRGVCLDLIFWQPVEIYSSACFLKNKKSGRRQAKKLIVFVFFRSQV
jgi:hypothetical protein